MKLGSFGKNSLLLTLCVMSVSTSLANADDQIPCPSLGLIQKSATKLDTVVRLDDTHYSAYTSSFAFKEYNLEWMVGVNMVTANSEEDARVKMVKIISTTSISHNTYAHEFHGAFICNYGEGDISTPLGHVLAVGAPHILPSLLKQVR